MVAEGVEVGLEVGYGMTVGICIVDTETTADIDGAEAVSFPGIFRKQSVDGLAQEHEWLVVGYL